MIGDMTLGRYCNTDSVLHRTDPRVKLILYVIYLVAIFMVTDPLALMSLVPVLIVKRLISTMNIARGNTGFMVSHIILRPVLLMNMSTIVIRSSIRRASGSVTMKIATR